MSNPLLTGLLRDVSRSFYLTLRLLPAGVRQPIGLAYLLARATDTIADTALVPVAERLAALDSLRNRILGIRPAPLDFRRFTESPADGSSPGERELLQRIEEAITDLASMPADHQQRIRDVLTTIAGGQELDLIRFELPQPNIPTTSTRTLASMDDLDDYTYRVAGCVGEFWTRICRAQLFPSAHLDDQALMRDAVRFGKGLQLVNILRDLPADLARGRCYMPADRLAALGLTPDDLRNPAHWPRFQPAYQDLLRIASEHLSAGWRYTCSLPPRPRRLRVACALPILIGARTLELLRHANPLDGSVRIKISRAEVRSILLRSILLLPFRTRWERLFAR